ncbi:MAG: hypothetical protein WD944_11755 [Steroidobacteraceae bacterium]
MLNRGVLIVRPAQPFLDWAAGLDDSGIVPNPDEEQTVYLVPSYEDDEEAAQVLKLVFAEVFERELFAWHTDDMAWPKQRTLTTFKQWFKVEMHSMVEDLCSDELVEEDDV